MITNYSTLTAAEAEYIILVNVNAVDELIYYADMSSSESLGSIIASYDKLTEAEKLRVADSNKYSSIKATYAMLLIDEIGNVTNQSGAQINAANSAYNNLTEAEKQLVTNYQVLVAANEAFEALVVDYTISWSYASETLTEKNGTTQAGFVYSNNGYTNGGMKIKNSSSNSITTPTLGSSKVTITITGFIADTNNADELMVVCNYEDGTSETITISFPENKATSSATLTFEGKAIKTISIIGLKNNTGKNFGLTAVEVVYTK